MLSVFWRPIEVQKLWLKLIGKCVQIDIEICIALDPILYVKIYISIHPYIRCRYEGFVSRLQFIATLVLEQSERDLILLPKKLFFSGHSVIIIIFLERGKYFAILMFRFLPIQYAIMLWPMGAPPGGIINQWKVFRSDPNCWLIAYDFTGSSI